VMSKPSNRHVWGLCPASSKSQHLHAQKRDVTSQHGQYARETRRKGATHALPVPMSTILRSGFAVEMAGCKR